MRVLFNLRALRSLGSWQWAAASINKSSVCKNLSLKAVKESLDCQMARKIVTARPSCSIVTIQHQRLYNHHQAQRTATAVARACLLILLVRS